MVEREIIHFPSSNRKKILDLKFTYSIDFNLTKRYFSMSFFNYAHLF